MIIGLYVEAYVKNHSLCLLQEYAPNTVSKYMTFVDNINSILQEVGPTDPTVFLEDFNAQFGTDN